MEQKHLNEINETKRQIRITTSKKRKYELTRHLRKLQKEYSLYCVLHKRCQYDN